MPDRKMVVEGLECCVSTLCRTCPYASRDKALAMCYEQLMKDALEVMKRESLTLKKEMTDEIAVEHLHKSGWMERDCKGTYNAAMAAAARMLEEQAEVIPCLECKYWDNESGLSVRMCEMWGRYTTQTGWCSRAKRANAK